MIWLAAVAGALAGAVIGYAAALALAVLALGLSGTGYGPDGGGAMAAAFIFGPMGGLLGLFVGPFIMLWLARRRQGSAFGGTLLKGFAVAGGVLALGAGVLAIAPFYQANFGSSLAPGGTAPRLFMDIRLDPRSRPPATARVDLNTSHENLPGRVADIAPPDPEGRTTLVAQVELYHRTSNRLVVLRLPGEPDRIFRLRLPAGAPQMDEMSAWQRVDQVSSGPQVVPAPPEDRTEIRYRVSWPGGR